MSEPSRYERENAERAELEQVRARIKEAQARGDSKEANRNFQEEMRIIARQKGSGPIVGGRDPNSPHGSRGA